MVYQKGKEVEEKNRRGKRRHSEQCDILKFYIHSGLITTANNINHNMHNNACD